MTKIEPYSLWIFSMRQRSTRRKLERDLGNIFKNNNMRKRIIRRIYEASNLQVRLSRGKDYPKRGGVYTLVCDLRASEEWDGESVRQNIINYIDGNPGRGFVCDVDGMGHGILVTEERL